MCDCQHTQTHIHKTTYFMYKSINYFCVPHIPVSYTHLDVYKRQADVGISSVIYTVCTVYYCILYV